MLNTGRTRIQPALALFGLVVLVGCERDAATTLVAPEPGADVVSTGEFTGPTRLLFQADEYYRGGCAVVVNDNGSIALQLDETYFEQAAIWTDGQLLWLPMPFIEISGLNRNNQLAGISYGEAYAYPLFWSAATGPVHIQTGQPVSIEELSRPVGINARGEVAISVAQLQDPFRQWTPPRVVGVWNSQTEQLRILPSPSDAIHDQAECTASAINDAGWVAGQCDIKGASVPFRWISGLPVRVPIPDRTGIVDVRIAAMNTTGAIAAMARRRSSPFVPVYWSSQTGWIDIPLPAGSTNPVIRAITNDGMVLMNIFLAGSSRGAVWSRTTGSTHLVPSRPDQRVTVFDMTEDGLIVGCFTGPDSPVAGFPATWRVRF
jgi:hypothetical protein